MSLTRTEADLIGSVASPASIAAGATTTSTALDINGTPGGFESALSGAVIVGSAPSASPTVGFFYSLDGTNYLQDGGNISIPVTASTTTPFGPYVPPSAAKKALVKVTNNDGASVAITCWAQGTVEASSNL